MTLKEKIDFIAGHFNEVAFGYNDSGGFWRLACGGRGAGSMMTESGIGWDMVSESSDFEESVDEFIAIIKERDAKGWPPLNEDAP